MVWKLIIIYYILTSFFWTQCQYNRLRKELTDLKWWNCLIIGFIFGWIYTPFYVSFTFMKWVDVFMNKIFDLVFNKFCSEN
jgi:hypothetical protein